MTKAKKQALAWSARKAAIANNVLLLLGVIVTATVIWEAVLLASLVDLVRTYGYANVPQHVMPTQTMDFAYLILQPAWGIWLRVFEGPIAVLSSD